LPGPYLNQGAFRTRITQQDSTQEEELGIFRFEAGKILRYCRAGDLIPRFESVRLDTARHISVGGQVLQTSGVTNMFVGIAEVTMAKDNFAWVTIYGPATGRVAAGEIPLSPLGPSANTGVLSIRNTSHFNAVAIAVESGLSAGSAVFISVL